MAAIERELVLDIGARQRLIRAAAEMRLAFFDHAAVVERRADMAGEFVRIGIVRIDVVADLGRQREHARILHGLVGEIAEPDIAAHKRRRDAIGLRELPRIAIRGLLLGGERLPQPVHRAFADFADDVA